MMKKLKLVSSNLNKLKEFQRILPEIEAVPGVDLREIQADKDLVILYKVKELNKDLFVVEDTIIEILEQNQWKEVVDIRYQMNNLQGQFKAKWITSLAYLEQGLIKVFRGATEGFLDAQRTMKGFGFDNYFIPQGEAQSLYDLGNKKDDYSARKKALINLKEDKPFMTKELKTLKKWTGKYQS